MGRYGSAMAGVGLVACTTFGGEPADGGASQEGAVSLDAASSPYAQAVVADAPILYLRLEDRAGNTVRDSSPSNLEAIVFMGGGALPAFEVPGAIGNSVSFSGQTGQRIEVSAQGFDFGERETFTLEAWFNLSGVDGNFRHFFTKDTNGGPRQEYGVFVNTNRGLTFERIIDDQAVAVSVDITKADGNWHHFAAVYDGNQLIFYVDGTAKSAADARPAKPKTQPLVIGAKNAGYGTLNGRLDEVAVYAKALDAARIAAHRAAR